jgi:hypothetical protein
VAQAGFEVGLQLAVVVDLLTQIRRGHDQGPNDPHAADPQRRLGARSKAGCPGAYGGAVAAVAIPLGESASRSGPQDFDVHGRRMATGAPTPDKTTAAECSTAVVGNSQSSVSGSTVVR